MRSFVGPAALPVRGERMTRVDSPGVWRPADKAMPPWMAWLLVDRDTGRIVIGQKPNLLMLVFIAATTARLVQPRQPAGAPWSAARVTQTGFLALWALDETRRGVNPFRRLGGAIVLCVASQRGLFR